MTHLLTTVEDQVWATLRAMTGASWIWLDMTGTGLHVGGELPEAVPAQLSHAWGWGPGWWVRARADVDLPGGIRAVRLTPSGAGQATANAPGRAVSVTAAPIQGFSTDTAVGHAAPGVTLPEGLRSLVVRLSETTPDAHSLSQTSVSFVDTGALAPAGTIE
jgi:hypothetical protein